ncbi:MAG: hypothetical protein ACRDPP_10050 [Gaiellaceae bacterium]
MAFHSPVHREFVLALRVLDAFEMPYAEAWRLLRPVAARLGVPRPSYSTVRRVVIVERERKRRRADELDQLLADLFSGRFPYVLVEHEGVGTAPGWETAGLEEFGPSRRRGAPRVRFS